MNTKFLIGGVVGGVLVWLFLRPKCPPCPKCGNGGGNVSPQILPSIVVQPPAALPKPAIGIPPAPPQNPIEAIEPPPLSGEPVPPPQGYYKLPAAFSGERTWAGWVK